MFWYHPHLHGTVADQLFGGLHGALLVDDADPPTVARERVIVVCDVTLSAQGSVAAVSRAERMAGREGELLLVNGRLRPVLEARAGSRERWRVVNACTSRYLRLAVRGQQVHLLGVDSGHQRPAEVTDVLLAPGNRADLLVTMRHGDGDVVTLGYDRGAPMMAMMRGRRARLSGPAPWRPSTWRGQGRRPHRPDCLGA